MECLVLGCSGSGKSTLLNRLSADDPTTPLPVLHPTLGSNVTDIYMSKRKCIRLREVSGAMRQTWSQYYGDCKAVIFMVDIGNKMQVSTFHAELLKLLSNHVIQELPVLLIFNKTRSPLAIPLNHLYAVFKLDTILASAPSDIKVIEADLDEGLGLDQILLWIKDKFKV